MHRYDQERGVSSEVPASSAMMGKWVTRADVLVSNEWVRIVERWDSEMAVS